MGYCVLTLGCTSVVVIEICFKLPTSSLIDLQAERRVHNPHIRIYSRLIRLALGPRKDVLLRSISDPMRLLQMEEFQRTLH